MDFHPIIVHFPIALLTLYSLFELIRFRKILEKPYWFYVKAVLAIFGSLGALVAMVTGLISANGAVGVRILDMHKYFGIATNIIFGIIALHYLFRWLKHEGIYVRIPAIPNWLVVTLALLGLVSITITAGLGGAMIFGTKFDPTMAPIFRLLKVY